MKYFKTNDFTLGATLMSFGLNIEHLDKDDPNRVQFCFPENIRLQGLVHDFWRGELKVEPQTFHQNQKILKSRIRNS